MWCDDHVRVRWVSAYVGTREANRHLRKCAARQRRRGARREATARGELARHDGKDLSAPRRVGAGDGDLDLEAAGAEEGGVDELWPVGEPDHKDVVQRLDAVHLRQQLVDDGVAYASGVTREGAALSREGVQLVEHDDVQTGLVAGLGLRARSVGQIARRESVRAVWAIAHAERV